MIRVWWIVLIAITLKADIDSKIEAIQKASRQERFRLMNALKEEIIHMKEEQRIEAIKEIQSIHNVILKNEINPNEIEQDREFSEEKEDD